MIPGRRNDFAYMLTAKELDLSENAYQLLNTVCPSKRKFSYSFGPILYTLPLSRAAVHVFSKDLITIIWAPICLSFPDHHIAGI
ncbi:hypothetical protein VTP01DRAFT_6232, partial [Rhizomucor pusillus]|uniref:uncharacterized protein n=1 Tax=Rhizomucor pusillus TaxID=4840 RepID=UPI0037433A16